MRNVVLIILFLAFSGVGFAQSSSSEEGLATFYSNKFNGRKTSNGDVYRHTKLTAAHPTLPFGTEAKVTNLRNGKSVIVRINDRCSPRHISIDLSRAAAAKIDMIRAGRQRVRIEVVNDSIRNDYLSQEVVKDSLLADSSKADSLVLLKTEKWNYTIQVASLATKVNADKLVSRLTDTYNQFSNHRRVTIKGKHLYKVMVGQFETREDAQVLLTTLKKAYPTAYIISKN